MAGYNAVAWMASWPRKGVREEPKRRGSLRSEMYRYRVPACTSVSGAIHHRGWVCGNALVGLYPALPRAWHRHTVAPNLALCIRHVRLSPRGCPEGRGRVA